jgi:hypothetical protein
MGSWGIAGFASEVNGKCLGASKSELLKEEGDGVGAVYCRSARRTSRGVVLCASTLRQRVEGCCNTMSCKYVR